MLRNAILATALATACSSDTDAALADYQAASRQLRGVVEGHVAEVEQASASADKDTLVTGYGVDWKHATEDMHHALDHLGDCDMDRRGLGMLSDAAGMMDTMEEAVQAHLAAHAEHADLADCQAAAEAHGEDMAPRLDEMESHHQHLGSSGMHCGDHHGAGHHGGAHHH